MVDAARERAPSESRGSTTDAAPSASAATGDRSAGGRMRDALRGQDYAAQVALLTPGGGADAGAGQRVAIPTIAPADPYALQTEDSTAARGRGAAPKGGKDAPAPAGDPARATLTLKTTRDAANKPPEGFGAMSPSFALEGIQVERAAGAPWTVAATLALNSSWGFGPAAATRKDITGPTDPQIDATNYLRIARDLDPTDGPDPAGKATRAEFFSRRFTQEHEQFHCADTEKWAASQALPTIQKQLATGHYQNADHVETALRAARDALDAAWSQWFAAGASDEASKPGEKRAYGAGFDDYRMLANHVEARGHALEHND